ncbi:MAG TPA: amino acid permease, partial [Acidiphilium sp.]
ALQIAFIGAQSPGDLAGGWSGLHFTGLSGPFAGLAGLLGMTWLAALLYIDSAVSPAGVAIIGYTSTPRLFFATSHEGLTRGPFGRLSKAGVPVVGVAIAFAVGILFLLPLPSWRAIIKVVSAAALLSYGMASVSLVTLRRTLPPERHPRPFKLAFGVPIAGIAFIVANFIIVWTGAHTANVMMGYVLIVAVIYAIVQGVTRRGYGHLEIAGAWWIVPYFAGLWALANLGPKNLTHGTGLLSNGWLSVILVLFSIAILAIAARSGLADPVEARETLAAR